jgi:hypothetical protein
VEEPDGKSGGGSLTPAVEDENWPKGYRLLRSNRNERSAGVARRTPDGSGTPVSAVKVPVPFSALSVVRPSEVGTLFHCDGAEGTPATGPMLVVCGKQINDYPARREHA